MPKCNGAIGVGQVLFAVLLLSTIVLYDGEEELISGSVMLDRVIQR